MKPLGVVGAPTHSSFPPPTSLFLPKRLQSHHFCVPRASSGSRTAEHAKTAATIPEYKPSVFDNLFLQLFRNKLVAGGGGRNEKEIHHSTPFQEVGWDSNKPGYDGLIEVANQLMMKGRTRIDTIEAAVRVLRSLFPPFLLELYKMLIAPIGGGKVAAMMVARVTALTCQWLMGPCKINSVDLDNGGSCSSGVYVERCKYLEESKCASICVNTCKFPTQTFFLDHMGVPLLMEPNFSDYSCQGTLCSIISVIWSLALLATRNLLPLSFLVDNFAFLICFP
ncbi:beta-carotene isomerase D27, chloroplastic isoform X2 [Prosopis cineraria]|uniref:beta-carotene isomerase D27, chloroplastic isoform X2 n=1 Tax=Prosopis cineraria TaxID=364024 RepID=UPI0024107115|nr:beta-carotene isomerase D27, chloroplastic isoform X2 [Prosopis cineraria]